jgi:hypothetical protein
MSENDQGTLHRATEGSVAGTHSPKEPFQFFVGPSTSSEFNLARLRLIPVACWKVEDVRFAFDSSFVTPEVATEIQQLRALRERHKNSASGKVHYPPLSVFGHADPVGPAVDPDGYNKALSGRRATAIYALLIVNSSPDTAVNLWRRISATEHWGEQQQQTMQANVPAGTSDDDLFKAYMQKLCPADFKLTPQDFLAQGADAQGKGDYQGCGSFNPLLIFSQTAENQHEQAAQNNDQAGVAARNAANAPNRRVMILLFRPGSQVVPAKWPCPSATGDKAGCLKRFWSDGEKRRHTRLPDSDRKFDDAKDTFACRFYQRLLTGSPCEKWLSVLTLRLFDLLGRPLPEAPFKASVADVDSNPGGDVEHADQNGDITLRNLALPATVTVQWSRPDSMRKPDDPEPAPSQTVDPLVADEGLDDEGLQLLFAAQDNQRVLRDGIRPPSETPEGFEYELQVFVSLDDGVAASGAGGQMTPEAARRRLNNLGYLKTVNLEDAIRVFQRDCGKQVTGQLADANDELRLRHDELNPPSAPNRFTGV